MSVIDKLLTPRERVIQRARLHWIIFLKPLLLVVIGVAVFVLVPDERLEQFSGIFFVFFALPYAASVTLTWLLSEVAVTDQRLIAKIGISRYSQTEAVFHKIEGADVVLGPLGATLDQGTVEVRFVGGVVKRLGNVRAPETIKLALERQIKLARGKSG